MLDALIYLPEDYNVSGKRYPLILFGHGAGETTLTTLAKQGLPGNITNGNPPYALVNGDTTHFIVLSITGQVVLPEKSMNDGAKYLIASGLRIDTDRIYITGLSAGAMATVTYIPHQKKENYQTVSAIVPMSFSSDWNIDQNVPDFSVFAGKGVWAFSGESDYWTPYSESLINSINSHLPGTGRLTIYNGGHCCWMDYYDPAYREKIDGKSMNIYEWMLQYNSKNAETAGPNKAPVANAGQDIQITQPASTVTLNGSASADPDGRIVSYEWKQTSGPSNAIIANATSAEAKVSGLQAGTYVFTLTVKDDKGAVSTAENKVTVSGAPNKAPVANAGKDIQMTLPVNTTIVYGSSSYDTDGKIVAYEWKQKSGPSDAAIEDPDAIRTKISDLQAGTYVFTLTVKDDKGAASTAEIKVEVSAGTPNRAPVANAGKDIQLTLPSNAVTLNGSASADPDGKIVSYEWKQISGPSNATITNATNAEAKVSGLQAGTYVFSLTVKDDNGASDEIKLNVNVAPLKLEIPVNEGFYADAGNDTTILYPVNNLFLDGSRSFNENGGMLFQWEKVSGPSSFLIKNPGNAITEVRNLLPGAYVFRLTVTDYKRNSVTDDITVTVAPDQTHPGAVSFTANTAVPEYNELFQYGTNPGSYGNGWTDTAIAGIALKAGVHSLRLPVPGYFVEHYGYDVRENEFNYYEQQLKMKALTIFVGEPGDKMIDGTTYPTAGKPSAVFKNLYAPIWDNGENGTPINDENPFAVYMYNLVKRYGQNTRFWEIVNEPDMTGFWDNGNKTRADNWWDVAPKPGDLLNLRAPVFYYIRMLRIAYEIIKKYDPEAYVAPGGLGYPAFLDVLLRYSDNPDDGKISGEYPLTGGAYFDVLSFHIYPAYHLKEWDNSILDFKNERNSDRAADAIIDLKKEFDSVLLNRGYNGKQYPKKPVILTETNMTRKNFSSYWGSEESQRNFIIKALIESQINEIKQFYVYGIAESADYNAATDPYDLMGLYENLKRDAYGSEKLTPEGKAFKTTSTMLYGWQYDVGQTNRLNLPAAVKGAAFKKGNQYRYVLWAKIQSDGNEKAGATFSFPSDLGLDSLDRFEWDYGADSWATSRVSAVNISLTGAPVFFTTGDEKAPGGNEVPVANAGKDRQITLPENTTLLDGSASKDPDGEIVSYKWQQTSGPANATIENPSEMTTNVSEMQAGTYIFTLTVKDNAGAQATDQVSVTVKPSGNTEGSGTSKLPVANAGKDLQITLPENTVTLYGSSSYAPGGTIVAHEWKQVSGPSDAAIEAPDAIRTKIGDLQAGTYVFTLTVKDDKGATATTNIKVQVTGLPNKAPIANAGKDIQITLPENTVVLNGSASSDPDGKIVSYNWKQTSGPSNAAVNNAASAETEVRNLQAGTYVFTLTVTDDEGATATDQISIIIKPSENTGGSGSNKAPVANAGQDVQLVLPENTVYLYGSSSYDTDGKIVSHAWTQTSGPSKATMEDANAIRTKISDLQAGTYVFTLTVTDDGGATATDQVSVTIKSSGNGNTGGSGSNKAPVANAGQDVQLVLPENTVYLYGSSSYDTDGKIVSHEWTQTSGPSKATMEDANAVRTKISNLQAGTYVFTLTVTDDGGATATDQVSVTIKSSGNGNTGESGSNKAPVANAGKDLQITLPVNTVDLYGSSSYDTDGKIVSHEWTQVSGPSNATIGDPNAIRTKISDLKAGTYVIKLTVKDDKGATGTTEVKIVVSGTSNKAPVANAGQDVQVTLPVNTVYLYGSSSYDTDGKIVSYNWKQTSGPSNATMEEANAIRTKISNLQAGTYVFTLTVTDDGGASATDQVKVTAGSLASVEKPDDPDNKAPVANAGKDLQITLPVNTVDLYGSSSYDTDGKIVSHEWTQVSGPSNATIGDPNAIRTKISDLQAGTYVIRLTVKDDKGATGTTEVKIVVSGTSNKAPVANAGQDVQVTLPVNTVYLYGSSSYDTDGKIVSYNWKQTSGPSNATMEDANAVRTKVSNLQAGTYIFTLTVKDDEGAQSADQISVTVNPSSFLVARYANEAPVAVVEEETLNVFHPNTSVKVDGSSSYDPDGKISSYRWTYLSGPSGAVIESPDAAVTQISHLDQAAAYSFLLKVTDNNKAEDSAVVTLEVYETPNQTPVALTGRDQIITLPADSVLLDGSASYDPDGKILDYKWEQQTGPEKAVLTPVSDSKYMVSGLKEGYYEFKLTVTDDRQAEETALTGVYVQASGKKVTPPFFIYPNPVVGGQLHVALNLGKERDIKFRIVDVNGSVVKLYNYGATPAQIEKVLDVSDLMSGMYFIQLIESNQLREVRRFFKR